MGQNNTVEKKLASTTAREPEEKRSRNTEIERREALELIDRLKELLDDYEIDQDSFIMPEDYDNLDVLNSKKNNKLRTTWFTLAFSRLESACDILQLDESGLHSFRNRFREIQSRESALCQADLARMTLSEDTVERIRQLKALKKKHAPELVQEKIDLIEAMEFVMRRNIAELQKMV